MGLFRWFGFAALGLTVLGSAGCGRTGPPNPGPDIIVTDDAPATSDEAAAEEDSFNVETP